MKPTDQKVFDDIMLDTEFLFEGNTKRTKPAHLSTNMESHRWTSEVMRKAYNSAIELAASKLPPQEQKKILSLTIENEEF